MDDFVTTKSRKWTEFKLKLVQKGSCHEYHAVYYMCIPETKIRESYPYVSSIIGHWRPDLSPQSLDIYYLRFQQIQTSLSMLSEITGSLRTRGKQLNSSEVKIL